MTKIVVWYISVKIWNNSVELSFTLRWQKLALIAFSFILELKLKHVCYFQIIFGVFCKSWKSSFSVAAEDDIPYQTIRSRNENSGVLPASVPPSMLSLMLFYQLGNDKYLQSLLSRSWTPRKLWEVSCYVPIFSISRIMPSVKAAAGWPA